MLCGINTFVLYVDIWKMMNIKVKIVWVFALLLGAPLFGVLTNESVVKMMDAGLSEDAIVLAI